MELQQSPTRATDEFVVIAPDGIAVHPVPLPGLLGVTLAEGRLPPGQFGIHAHRSLEQITYVLSGQVVVTMGDGETGETTEFACGEGDTIATPPLVSLSFGNPGPGEARMLFLCAPPYPADDADTMTLDRHRALTDEERRVARERIRAVRTMLDAQFGALEARVG